jgi:hypothetical protein
LSPTRTRQCIPAFLTIAVATSAIALAGVAGPASVSRSASTGAVSGAGSRPAAAVALVARAVPQSAHGGDGHRRTPRQIAKSLLRHRFGWKRWQFRYLNRLWAAESGWNRYASNPYSGAYGIPQAVPGSKMASAGPGWRWNARTQILWGMRYIKACYRTPYWAWLHQRTDGWY